MRKSIIGIALLFLMFASCVTSGSAEENDVSTIKVFSTSSQKFDADVAYVTMYVSGEGKKLEEAMAKVSQKSKNIREVLMQKFTTIKEIEVKTIHIGEKQMDYRRPDIELVPSVPQVFKQILITIEPNQVLIENIVDLAIENEAYIELPRQIQMSNEKNNVVVYGLVNTERAEIEVSKTAVEDARRKAMIIAKNAGMKLDGIFSIELQWGSDLLEQRYYYRNKPPYKAKYISEDKDFVEVFCFATVEFEIEK